MGGVFQLLTVPEWSLLLQPTLSDETACRLRGHPDRRQGLGSTSSPRLGSVSNLDIFLACNVTMITKIVVIAALPTSFLLFCSMFIFNFRNTFVLEYCGEVLDHKEFKTRVKEYARNKNIHYYFMSLKNNEVRNVLNMMICELKSGLMI